jgi:AcrR family transcriptional regulator
MLLRDVATVWQQGPAMTSQPDSPPVAADLRHRLMKAALAEFAQSGFDGARLERIAIRADCAKRMIYYYFGNKDDLYDAVLEHACNDIRAAERALDLAALPPLQALHALARQSFRYHQENADFSRLVLQENLQRCDVARGSVRAGALCDAAVQPLADILSRGTRDGSFRDGVDPVELHYLISALSGFRVDHALTWSRLMQVDLLGPQMHDRLLHLLLAQVTAHVQAV